jgi:hypothetical protein
VEAFQVPVLSVPIAWTCVRLLETLKVLATRSMPMPASMPEEMTLEST